MEKGKLSLLPITKHRETRREMERSGEDPCWPQAPTQHWESSLDSGGGAGRWRAEEKRGEEQRREVGSLHPTPSLAPGDLSVQSRHVSE